MRLRKNRAFARTAECVSYSRKGGNIEASVQMLAAALGGKRTGTRARKRRRPRCGAYSAVVCLRITPGITGNIAATPAIFAIVLGRKSRVTNKQFEREMRYRVSIAVANSMLRQGLINQTEYDGFNRLMAEKHRPLISGLLLKSSVDKHRESS